MSKPGALCCNKSCEDSRGQSDFCDEACNYGYLIWPPCVGCEEM